MRKHLLTAALGGVLSLIMGASGALADYTFTQQPNQLAIRLGAIFPTVNNAQTFGGTTQFLGGLDYTLSATRGNSPSSTGLYFDYQSGSHNAGYLHSGGLASSTARCGQCSLVAVLASITPRCERQAA